MTWLYGCCAIIGTTVLVCQFAMSLLGFGGHDLDGADSGGVDSGADVPHDAGDSAPVTHDGQHTAQDSSWFFGIISFRTLTAALAFFGLAGLALDSMDTPGSTTLVGAALAGVGAMYLVHGLMKSMTMLRADGTLRIQETVGVVGTVYVPIPARHTGVGKVTVALSTQTVELEARTALDALPTGAKVMVTRVLGADLVEVISAEQRAA